MKIGLHSKEKRNKEITKAKKERVEGINKEEGRKEKIRERKEVGEGIKRRKYVNGKKTREREGERERERKKKKKGSLISITPVEVICI